MKHETKRHQGDAALAYAGRNEGAYLHIDPDLVATDRHGELYALPEETQEVAELSARYGVEIFSIIGGVSDENDEAFFLWLLTEYDYLRSRIRSTDFTGELEATFYEEEVEDIGIKLEQLPLKGLSQASSVTLECIGLRLAREGKVRAIALGDGHYAFVLPDAAPLKVWGVMAATKEAALKALAAYEPAVIVSRDSDGVIYESPSGRLE